MKLFWGKTENPGELRFHISTLLTKDGQTDKLHFIRHEISALYGFQVGNSFLGIIRVGQWGISNVGRAALQEAKE